MLRRAAQKRVPRLWWTPLVVGQREVWLQGMTEVTSPSAGEGPGPSVAATGGTTSAGVALGTRW